MDSNVETYLRVRLIDVLVLKYTNAAGVTSEIQVINKDELQLNYDESWHRAADGYYYYMEPVKKEASGSKLVPFIIEYFEGTYYNLHPANYSIQLGIEIDAVQALGGPESGGTEPALGRSWLKDGRAHPHHRGFVLCSCPLIRSYYPKMLGRSFGT